MTFQDSKCYTFTRQSMRYLYAAIVAVSIIGCSADTDGRNTRLPGRNMTSEAPERIVIPYQENFFTHYVGRFSDGGQYAGFLVPLLPDDRRTVAVLHLFDEQGRHLSSEVFESDDRVELDSWIEVGIEDAGDATPGDICVRLFETELVGEKFGLILLDNGNVEYKPLGLVYKDPWDGSMAGVRPLRRQGDSE